MFKLSRKKIVLGLLGMGLLLLWQTASAANKIGYVVLSGDKEAVKDITSNWHELGKRFSCEVETVPSIVFSDPTKTKEYQGFIIDNVICFTKVEAANMEGYVKEGGVIVAIGEYALNAFDEKKAPEDHKFDPKKDFYSIIDTTVGWMRCVIPQAMGAGGGLSVLTEKVKFIEHPLTKGLLIGEWVGLKKIKGNKLQRFNYFGLIPNSGVKSLAQCQVAEDPAKTVDVFTYNEYGKGKCIWLGIPVDKATEYDEKMYLQLAKNIFEMIGNQQEVVKSYESSEKAYAKKKEEQISITLTKLRKQWRENKSIIRIGIYKPEKFVYEVSNDATPGAKGIYQALKDIKGLEVEFIPDLKEETIFKYTLIVLSSVQELGKEEKGDFRLALLNYVDCGFGILLTHTSTGYKGALFNPLFSTIAQGVSESNKRDLIVVDASHPITKDLSKQFKYTYWNHINLEPGTNGKILIKDDKVNPVVVAGNFGNGKVVEIGSLIGRDDFEEEVVPVGDELKLLRNSIQWLSEGEKEINFLDEKKKIELSKYLGSKFIFKGLWYNEWDDIPNIVKNLSRMGFNAVFSRGDRPKEKMESLIEEGKKRNIGIYLSYSPFISREFLKEHPEYKQIDYKEFQGGEGVDPSNAWFCPDRPETRAWFLNILKKNLKTYPGITGVALDGIRYKEDALNGCFCKYSIEKRAEFVKGHQELSKEKAERKFNEDSVISFVEEWRTIIKSINPNLKLFAYTCYFHDQPINWKHKFPLDYHSLRASCEGWRLPSIILKNAEEQVAHAQQYHKFTIAAPMIDFYGPSRTPDQVRAEIRAVGKSGAKGITVWLFDVLMYSNGEFKDPEVAKAFSEEVAGNWWQK